MSIDPPPPHDNEPVTSPSATVELPLRHRVKQLLRTLQVRLRFVAVFGVAFLIVGYWSNLRDAWDAWQHRFFGGHRHQQTLSNDTEYFCPMCPGVVNDWPAICPVCNMDLIRRKRGEAVLLPEGVVARMQLSPYRIQLAGISTTAVEQRRLVREMTFAGRLVEVAESPEADRASTRFALECAVSASDFTLLKAGLSARVMLDHAGAGAKFSGIVDLPAKEADSRRSTRLVPVRLLDQADWLKAGMSGTAVVAIPLTMLAPFSKLATTKSPDDHDLYTAVPESAVVDIGDRRLAFVETMPGMFDGVEVTLGPRCGDYYPVVSGVTTGQRVATTGAFLIDAEARLSPDLAAAYFGASRTAAPTPPMKIRNQSAEPGENKLSAADEKLASEQKICPVTEFELDSMGGPIPIEVVGKRVFICCKGCEKALRADPQKYLAKLKK